MLEYIACVLCMRAVMLTYRSGISSDPEGRERGSLLHALRESTLPRLVSKDVQAMEMLIYDFFGGFEKAKNYTINTLKVYIFASSNCVYTCTFP